MSGPGPIQIGDIIEVWGDEVKTPEELAEEVKEQEALENEEPKPVILSENGLVDL